MKTYEISWYLDPTKPEKKHGDGNWKTVLVKANTILEAVAKFSAHYPEADPEQIWATEPQIVIE